MANCAIAIHVDCDAEGHGIDPTDPPWVWEALGPEGWVRCDVDDRTGGFNEPGDVIVHVPGSHVESVLEERTAGWIRCRIVEPLGDTQTPYTDSPLLRVIEADTIGGTVVAVHGEDVIDEIVGVSEGVPGQRFLLLRRPVVASERPVAVEIAAEGGWVPWTQVQTFGESAADDRHWRLNANEGTIVFGPAVRMEDGSLRNYGAVPPVGSHVRVRRYRTGGGRVGNVGTHEIVTLRSAIPFINSVDNRRPAIGGVDGESVDAAKTRTARARHPQPRRHGTRLRAAGAARRRPRWRGCAACPSTKPAGSAPARVTPPACRVLVVPAVASGDAGRMTFEQLLPSDHMMATVSEYLEERRMVGARVIVTPPRYLGVTAVIRLRARTHADPEEVRARTVDALYHYFDPLVGGPDGDGWAFGRPILLGDVFGVSQRVEGVDLIEDARMFPADPISGQRGEAITRIDLDPDSLAFSYGHQVQVLT